MPDWILKYWVEWAFGLVIALLSFLVRRLFTRLRNEKAARETLAALAAAETEALKSGMRSLLRRQIIADCKEALAAGYCEETVKDAIAAMYEAYHGLGGNGIVTEAWNTVMSLPLVPLNVSASSKAH